MLWILSHFIEKQPHSYFLEKHSHSYDHTVLVWFFFFQHYEGHNVN